MMSQTSTDVNPNSTPPAYVIEVERLDDAEELNGWEKWSLKDVIRVLKDMTKEWYGVRAMDMGNILLYKLLEAAADPNVPFELIEETTHAGLEWPTYMKKRSAFHALATLPDKRQVVCDFFKKFVKYGVEDARYYDLIYTMLTYRLAIGSHPLGFQMSLEDGFNDEVLAKLPPEMQEELKGASFYEDDDESGRRTVYSLLTGESIAM